MTFARFAHWLMLSILAIALPFASSVAQDNERRVALVIGIGGYQNAPHLTNPVNDARAIGDSLRRLKFDVTELYDADFRELNSGVRSFGIRAANADVAVIYYAGHGVQVDRENFLIPADAKLERERDLLYEAMPLDRLLGEVSQANRIGIVLLDSCRNNPFIERVSRSMTIAGRAVATTPGLARVDNVPRNTMVVMAAKADQIAEDGSTEHSPFAAALLAHLQIPGLELSLFFRSVRDAVLRGTANRQEPYVFSSLGAEPFYFYPRPPNHPPQIGQLARLDVLDTAGPVPLGIPRPTDPDQDPLTVRVVGLPLAGEVRVDGRAVASSAIFSLDKFMTATFKPDGRMLGPVGTLDILVEDGRGGTATASLPITVLSSNHPPVVEGPRSVSAYPTPLGIAMPSDPDGNPMTVTIAAVPRGMVRHGTTPLKPGDRLQPEDLAGLNFVPEPGVVGHAGSLRYVVDDGRGGTAEGRIDVEVADPADIVSDSRLWARVQDRSDAADLDAFLRLFPDSRFADAARQRRAEIARRAPDAPPSVIGPSAIGPVAAGSGTSGPGTSGRGRPAEAAPAAAIVSPTSAPSPPLVAATRPQHEATPGEPPPEAGKQFALLQPRPQPPAEAATPPAPKPSPIQLPAQPPPPSAPSPSASASAARGAEAKIFKDCPDCPSLVRIADGSFSMGQGAREPEATPAHHVAVRGFALGQYPVTLGEWKTCMADGGCGFLPRMASTDERIPVHNLSWDDAQQYLVWLSRKTAHRYRLPSEAEWEYAARGGAAANGANWRYWWGNEIGATTVNCVDCGGRQDPHAPLPVDQFQPNGFGLSDMLGGVAQWTADCWFATYQGAPTDGTARDARTCLKRVLRGGSFRAKHDDVTLTARDSYDSSVRYFVNGFRVARDLN
jgi:formylglycine-generating enzyme required for sulfatase activity